MEFVELLLEVVDLQAMNVYEAWLDALIEASEWGDMHVIKTLISTGACSRDTIPLVLTADNGWHVKNSLETPDQSTTWQATPLSVATLQGNRAATDLLISHGVQLNPRASLTELDDSPRWHLTALADCVVRHDVERLHECLRRGADPFDNSAFYLAVFFEMEDIVKVLMHAFRARYPRETKLFGSDALCWMTRVENVGILKLLVEYADPLGLVEVPQRHSGYECIEEVHFRWSTPLGEAIRLDSERGGGSKVLHTLLAAIKDLNNITDCLPGKITPLLYASQLESLSTICTLITAGANISMPALRGIKRTPLQGAVKSGSTEIVNLLLQQGVDASEAPAARAGATALQLASLQGLMGIADILLENHANVNAEPAMLDGRAAFEGAVEYGRIDMMLHPAQNGADLLSNDQQKYRRAVRFAENNGQYAAKRFADELLAAALKDKETTQFHPGDFTFDVDNLIDFFMCDNVFDFSV